MDRHERFMECHTADIRHLVKRNTANLELANELSYAFHDIMQASYTYTDSLEILGTIRAIFCLFYQYTFFSDQMKKENICIEKIMIDFDKFDLHAAQIVLDSQLRKAKFRHWAEVSVVLDILVLHMTLHFKVSEIWLDLGKLQKSINQHLKEENAIRVLDMKLIDCYMDSLILHTHCKRPSSINEVDTNKLKALFLRNLKLGLTLKDRKASKLITSFLPKLIKVIDISGMFTAVWELMFTLKYDSGKMLSTLQLTTDIWFPIDSKSDYSHKELIDQAMEERLWSLLLEGLSSQRSKHRKRALQLVRRVVDFVEKHRTLASQFCKYENIRPLLCIGNDSQQSIFTKNLKIWFSVLEELENDEEHSVTPFFSLLRYLLKETFDLHVIHIAWIRCVFLRILQDDNTAVVNWGLMEVLNLHLKLYDDKFLTVVLEALNNTSFYEINENEEKPTLVKNLTIFLNNAESQSTDIVTRIMVQASKMIWDPVPLFHIIHAVSMVKKVETVWAAVELKAVNSLAEITLNIHCPILRIGSQIELLQAMTHFATGSLDLLAVANTLSAFSTSEVLIRDQLGWKQACAWLKKTLTETEATSFLENVCRQLANGNSETDLSLKSLSVIIMLLYDGHLALNTTVCPGFLALRRSLDCLTEGDSKPYANAELKIRAIQLLGYLLEASMSKDCILNELISSYANVTLRLTFKNLRKTFNEAFFNDMSIYVQITEQLFMAKSSIIHKRDVFRHIEKFQIESWNIIDDGELSNNVQRFFGIKILHACVKATSPRLRNYKFIGSLHKTYRNPLSRSFVDAEEDDKTRIGSLDITKQIESEYYKIVAELFEKYVTDTPVDEWLPNIDWIEEASHLNKVGGMDIFVPLIGILSQIFYKKAVVASDMDDFKSTVELCWNSTLESEDCRIATEKLIEFIFSSSFLDCEETKGVTIECTRQILEKGNNIPGLAIILLKGLKRVEGKQLSNFYEAILDCLLYGSVQQGDKKIGLQACSYILDCYQETYPNYLSKMNINTSVAPRAHAITLLHKMITDDPTHATKLVQLIIAKLGRIQTEQDLEGSQEHCITHRCMQVLLILQPILETDTIETLHTLLCNNVLSKNSQPSVRIIQEWLLIRIYLQNENLRTEIWYLFEQGEGDHVDGLCSVISVVYHVARLLSSDWQPDFIYIALNHIMPCCMADELNIRLHAQVVASKLFDLAYEKTYSMITEKYKELYIPLKKKLERGNRMKNSIKLLNDFLFTDFKPIDDYSLESLFHKVPKLSGVSSDEYILPQMFDKFGFKESNSHPLNLLNRTEHPIKIEEPYSLADSSESNSSVTVDTASGEDRLNDVPETNVPDVTMAKIKDEPESIDDMSMTIVKEELG